MLENVVIMAGGEGQRLRPLTEERPKPLMPLLDEPVVGMTLHLLRRHGIRDATLTVCYRAADIRHALGDGSAYGLNLHYLEETTPRGTAGGVADASRRMQGTVLVMSGDGLTDADLTALYQRHVISGAAASIVLKRVDQPGDYGVCEVDAQGWIRRFREKPGADAQPGSLVNTGIYFLEAAALAQIPDEGMFDFGRELFPALVASGAKIGGLETEAYWCDIGSRAAYAKAQADLLMGRVGLPIRGRRMGHAIMGTDCSLAPDVRVTGRCYIGNNAAIGQGTVLGPGTIVSGGAQVGHHVHLENTCLWENVRVEGGSILKNVVVTPRRGNSALQRIVPYERAAAEVRNGS